jgi:hypothetical protein
MMASSNHSKRFTTNLWTEKLVPVFLIVLLVILFGTFIIIGLSIAGLIPTT